MYGSFDFDNSIIFWVAGLLVFRLEWTVKIVDFDALLREKYEQYRKKYKYNLQVIQSTATNLT